MSNPNTDVVIMTALAQILPVGTTLLAQHPILAPALYGQTVYIQDEYAMAQGGFPALLLHAGPQVYDRNSTSTFIGGIQIICEYADRWDSQPNTIKVIRDAIAADLEIMKRNVGRNESLVIGPVAYATSVPRISLSPYLGSEDSKLVPGFIVIKRFMTLSINILPYDEL